MSEADRSRGPDRRTANLEGIAQLAGIERRSRWYVGEPGLEETILAEMRRFLTAKRALATTVQVRRVERLARSRLTGKTPFVVTDPRHLFDAGDDTAR